MNETFNPFDTPSIKDPIDEEWAAKRHVAAEARRLIEHLVTCSCDVPTLNDLARQFRQQADELARSPRLLGRIAFEEFEHKRYGNLKKLGYELNPVGGKCNPVSPPLDIWIDGDVARGRAKLGWQYEGPSNCVHGGVICALFDHFLGVAQILVGQPGPTGTLTTRFIRPTPLCTELRLEGRVKSVSGRKNLLTGELWADDILTASCEGLFINVSPERFRAMRDTVLSKT